MSDFFRDLIAIGKKIVEASEAIQAEIDRHSPLPPESQATTSDRATAASASASASSGATAGLTYSDAFRRHIEGGCHDPLKLLSVEDAERLMGCPIAVPSTLCEEEYIGLHYGCADDRSMYVALTVSSRMPWDIIVNEVTTQPAPRPVGDEALVAGGTLYVRQGDAFFWIYGRGVSQDTIYNIAAHAAAKMSG